MKLTQIETKTIKQKDGETKEIKTVKEIDYQITGYEFPNEKPTPDEFNYDANWLNDKIIFEGKSYSTAGILTTELAEFIDDLQEVVDEKTEFCELKTVEIGFQMSVKRVKQKYLFTISFGIHVDEIEKHKVSQLLEKQTLKEKLEELKVFLQKFPIRK